MKTFEERYTAWIDGRLSGDELARFERELPDRAAAEADRAQAQGLAHMLRKYGAPTLANEHFFSHQLHERIAAETRATERPASAPREWRFFTLPNLAWAGVCSFLLAGAMYFALVAPYQPGGGSLTATALPVSAVHVADAAPDSRLDRETSVYDASIIEATPQQPGVSATSVYSKAENMTVLWLDGLEYLPASYQLQ